MRFCFVLFFVVFFFCFFFVLGFLKDSTTEMRTAKALARLRLCAGSPEPLLVAFVISTLVTGEKNSNHQCRDRGSNPGRLRDRRTRYRVAIKAGLYCKAVQVYHIPITTTYSPSILRFVHESLFEQPLNIRPPSLLDHQAHQMGLFTLGARCNR